MGSSTSRPKRAIDPEKHRNLTEHFFEDKYANRTDDELPRVVDGRLVSPSSSTERLLPDQSTKTDALISDTKLERSKVSTNFVPVVISREPFQLAYIEITPEMTDSEFLDQLESLVTSEWPWELRDSWKEIKRPMAGFTVQKFVRVGPSNYVPAVSVDPSVVTPTQAETPRSDKDASNRDDSLNIKVAARPKCIICYGGNDAEFVEDGFWSLSSCRPASSLSSRNLIQRLPTVPKRIIITQTPHKRKKTKNAKHHHVYHEFQEEIEEQSYILHALHIKILSNHQSRGPAKLVCFRPPPDHRLSLRPDVYMYYPADSTEDRWKAYFGEIDMMSREKREALFAFRPVDRDEDWREKRQTYQQELSRMTQSQRDFRKMGYC